MTLGKDDWRQCHLPDALSTEKHDRGDARERGWRPGRSSACSDLAAREAAPTWEARSCAPCAPPREDSSAQARPSLEVDEIKHMRKAGGKKGGMGHGKLLVNEGSALVWWPWI